MIEILDGRATLYEGHALNALKLIPDNSAHMIFTSPPYYGLRDYGTDYQVWGGDSDCEHEWGHEQTGRITGGSMRPAQGMHLPVGSPDHSRPRHFCVTCGAWRGELGNEPTPDLYVAHIVEIMREARRVLRPEGTLWINIDDSYSRWSGGDTNTGKKGQLTQHARNGGAVPKDSYRQPPPGMKPKDMIGLPWMIAFGLRADGWYLRCDIIWNKTNNMPESVEDRPTRSHEYVFLLSKSELYYYDAEAIKEPVSPETILRMRRAISKQHKNSDGAPGQPPHSMTEPRPNDPTRVVSFLRNKHSVWDIATVPFKKPHFATFPPKLVSPGILAGSSEKGCCNRCGAPYKRLVKKMGGNWEERKAEGAPSRYGKVPAAEMMLTYAMSSATKTVGWSKTCKCEASVPVPCTVLDVFSGTATTGMVALRLGRHCKIIELKHDSFVMGRDRLLEDARAMNMQFGFDELEMEEAEEAEG